MFSPKNKAILYFKKQFIILTETIVNLYIVLNVNKTKTAVSLSILEINDAVSKKVNR